MAETSGHTGGFGEEKGRPARVARGTLDALSLAFGASRWKLLLYAGLMSAGGVFPLAASWLTKLLLDRLVVGGSTGALLTLAACLAAVGVAQGVTPHATDYLGAELRRGIGVRAQTRLFASMNRFVGLGPFEDPVFHDRLQLAKRSGRDSPGQVVDGVLGSAQSLVTITGFVGSLFVLAPTMAAFVVVFGVPTLVAEVALSRRRAATIWRVGHMERRELFYNQLLSSVEAAKEVRLFGLGDFFLRRMQQERREVDAAVRAVDRGQLRVQSVLALTAAVVAGAGLVWAVNAARTGGLSVGDVSMFAVAVAGVQGALGRLASDVAGTHQALALFDHYREVTSTGPELPVPACPKALPELREGIELRDVWFRYSEDHPWILRGVNLTIRRGQALALVGLNGAGKSTLVKLLCRFHDPTRGAILWDGTDIRDVDPERLRNRLGAVFQDHMHYDMTARENIGVGDLEAMHDTERVERAARRAGVHDTVVGLPRGYDTPLTRIFFMEADKENEETGVVLSGGQTQRLALARAFLREGRDLVILDEPSSGLDAEAEYEIHRSLRRHREGRTSLLISHRLGSVRDADRIVVLSGGRVVEEGDHASLTELGGEYARLFEKQASGYREEGVPAGPAEPVVR